MTNQNRVTPDNSLDRLSRLADWEEPPKRPRGRPEKHVTPEQWLAVLARLDRGDTYGQACKDAGTSRYLVDKARAEHPALDFELRVAAWRTGRRRLAQGSSCPFLVIEAQAEADALNKQGRPRTWPEVELTIQRRRETDEASVQMYAPVAIPDGDPAF